MSVVRNRCHSNFRVDRILVGAHRALSTQSTTIAPPRAFEHDNDTKVVPKTQTVSLRGLHRLPTAQLVRSLALGSFFSSPFLFKPGFAVLRFLANSRAPLLDVDSNPILRSILKPLLYDHFCAGRDYKSIASTRAANKKTGYSGVILCYGKEMEASDPSVVQSQETTSDAEVEHWRKGNLETLSMMGEGDWLGIKMTGAGSGVVQALMADAPIPPSFAQAMDEVCQQAARQNCRLWIDSEQGAVQKGIDSWTIDLMRRHNRSDHALVYNTLQAYLKTSRAKLQHQLTLSQTEGWKLGIKVVRGAYIEVDPRDNIHDTKAQTDDSYNGIVRDLLSGQNLGFAPQNFPSMELFLAGHNPESINLALAQIHSLRREGRLKVMPNFGQLQGMGDQVGCDFLEQCEEMKRVGNEDGGVATTVPRMYKCLTWGSIRECMQYLVRRAVENRGGSDRMRDGMAAYRGELRRRLFGGGVGG